MAASTLFQCPALWLAVAVEQTEEVRQLLAGGAHVEEQGGMLPDRSSPLQVAVYRGYTERCEMDTELALLLLENGADVSATANEGQTALHLASSEAVSLLLLQHGADVSAKATGVYRGMTPLHMAARVGNTEVVRVLIEHRANASAEDDYGRTAEDSLHLAQAIAGSHLHRQVMAMLQAEAVIRAKCVAFAMGHHERLGVGSRLQGLDPEMVRKVLEQV